jgi:hypothetical protein
MQKTREKYIPEKSKFYIRKNKIYVALYKAVNKFQIKFKERRRMVHIKRLVIKKQYETLIIFNFKKNLLRIV